MSRRYVQRECDVKDTNRIEIYSDGTDSGVKLTDGGGTSEDDLSPPLPPRPPPRARTYPLNPLDGESKSFIFCF